MAAVAGTTGASNFHNSKPVRLGDENGSTCSYSSSNCGKTIERPSDSYKTLKACEHKLPATVVGPNLLVCAHTSFNVLYGQKFLLHKAEPCVDDIFGFILMRSIKIKQNSFLQGLQP